MPSANVATTEFVTAAKAQYSNLGFPNYEVVTVPHPIWPQTKEQMYEKADTVIDLIAKRLTEPPPR